MLVGRERKRFEPALVAVAHAGGAVLGIEAQGMGDRVPAEEVGDLCVLPLLGPVDEMPVVGHERVAENAYRQTLVGFGQKVLRGGEIGHFFE